MISIKRNVNVALEKRKKDGIIINDNVPIFLRVTYNSNRVNLFSGFRIDRKDWNDTQSLVKNGKINSNGLIAEEINTNLSNLINDIHTFFIKCLYVFKIKWQPGEMLLRESKILKRVADEIHQ